MNFAWIHLHSDVELEIRLEITRCRGVAVDARSWRRPKMTWKLCTILQVNGSDECERMVENKFHRLETMSVGHPTRAYNRIDLNSISRQRLTSKIARTNNGKRCWWCIDAYFSMSWLSQKPQILAIDDSSCEILFYFSSVWGALCTHTLHMRHA